MAYAQIDALTVHLQILIQDNVNLVDPDVEIVEINKHVLNVYKIIHKLMENVC